MTTPTGSGLDHEALLASLNDGVYAVDTRRRITYWSPSAERITGWRAEEILGKHCAANVLAHVDKDGRRLCGREHCPLHRAMVTGTGSHVPVVVFAKHKTGHLVPMRVSVAPIRDGSGEIIGGVETFRDVSEEHHDAERARRIQSAMLHRQPPQDRRVTFTTYYLPFSMVGGDYYATARVDGDRFAFMLADVSGHGSAAALYTVYLDALWQSHRDLLPRPAELARAMGNQLAELIGDDDRFATAIFGLLDLEAMSVALTFAGGPAPLLFRCDGEPEVISGSGMPLGFPFDDEYEAHTVPVQPGDHLLAFSDGVPEISDVDGELLGLDGLLRILADAGYPAYGDFAAVEKGLLKSSDRIRFDDDLTFLEVRLT
jgi:PAS domain S-box-containing protein